MALLQLLLSSSFTFLNILTTFESALAINDQNISLPDYIIPTHYNISLIEQTSGTYFIGVSQIFITIYRPTVNISFHMRWRPLALYPKECNLTRVNFTEVYIPKLHYYHQKREITDLEFANEISPGQYILVLVFNSLTNEDNIGFFKTFYHMNVTLLYQGKRSDFLASYSLQREARHLFPCWDEPIFNNATFNISILYYKNYTILSNMGEKTCEDSNAKENDTKWVCFRETPPMPAYLLAIVISDLPIVSSVSFPRRHPLYEKVYIFCKHHLAKYLKFTKMIIENVTLYMDSQYVHCTNYPKVDYVTVPSYYPNVVQNKPGLVFFRETDILMYDEKFESIGRKVEIAHIVGREVTHQCLDNQGSPYWWPYSWLNEALATLLIEDVFKTIESAEKMLYLFKIQIYQESLRLDDPQTSIMKPLSELDELYPYSPFSYYIKAPNILRMLKYILTAEVFADGIKIFLENISWYGKKLHSTFDDFWAIMQSVLNESDHIPKFNVTEIVNSWTGLNHYPIINVQKMTDSRVNIFVENISDLKQVVWIPFTILMYSYGEYKFIADKTLKLMPLSESYTMDVPRMNWIIIDMQQDGMAGYYRVNYEYWIKIIHSLTTADNPNEVHVLTRARMVDDVFYFVINNKLTLSIFLVVAEYMWQESSYIVWYPMIKTLEHISVFFLFEEGESLKTHMQNMLSNLLWKIGYIEYDVTSNNIKLLRQEATKWACNLDVYGCKTIASIRLSQHLSNISNYKILPWWKNWIYCNGLSNNNDVWLRMFNLWRESHVEHSKLLEYLSCSRQIFNHFDVINEECEPSPCKDIRNRLNAFLSSIARYAKNRDVLQNIFENFDQLKPKEVSVYSMITVIINNLYTLELISLVRKFLHIRENSKIDAIYSSFKFYDQNDVIIEIDKFMRLIMQMDKRTSLFDQKLRTRVFEMQHQLGYFQPLIDKHE